MSNEHLNESEYALLTDYVRLVADGMGLRDFKIVLVPHPAEPTFAGTIQFAYGRKVGLLELGEQWRDDPEDLRDTIVHELMHCHLVDVISAPLMVEQELSPGVFRIFSEEFTRRHEMATDTITTAFSSYFPLPPGQKQFAAHARKLARDARN